MDFSGIERTKDVTEKTVLDFVHPYCANKRETHENHNSIFRCFYSMRTDFSN